MSKTYAKVTTIEENKKQELKNCLVRYINLLLIFKKNMLHFFLL
jgi:hypothetical protein